MLDGRPHMPSTPIIGQISCLLVDDHPSIRDGTRMLIEQYCTDITIVGETNTGEGALDLMRALAPDIALVDASLTSAMDGFTITEIARDEKLATRVIIFTASSGGGNVRRAFESGAYGYVTKTSPWDAVVSALRSVAAGHRYVDPESAAHLLGPVGPVLSGREHEVLALLAEGMQNDGIAFRLGITGETVKSHVSSLFVKLHVQNRSGAVAYAFRSGLVA